MENNISLEISEQNQSDLPKWFLIIPLFFGILFLFNYVYFKDIFLVSEGRGEDFEFSNFLIYNLGLKLIVYPFKFLGIAGLVMLGAFLFKVEKMSFSVVLKVVLLAELVKYLPELLKILWFTFIDMENLEGYDLTLFDDYLSLNGLMGMTKENVIYPLFQYLNITQVLYMSAVAQLLKMASDKNFMYHLQWFGVTYGVALLLLGLFYVILAL